LSSISRVSSGEAPAAYQSSHDEKKDAQILVPSHGTVNDPSETCLSLEVLKAAMTFEAKKK
jgi:hypothetical protein